jgi:preprotein translocase subunit SecA
LIELPKDWLKKVDTLVPELLIKDLTQRAIKALDERQKNYGEDVMNVIMRLIFLKTIDSAWLNHLETMDHLREGIGLRGYGQLDPLVEYKTEAFNLFNRLQSDIRTEIVNSVLKVDILPQQAELETPETAITEGAQAAAISMERSAKLQQKSSNEVRTRRVGISLKLQPIRKRSKKKKKKRR